MASLRRFEDGNFKHTYVAYPGEDRREVQFDRTDRSFAELERLKLIPRRLIDSQTVRQEGLTVLDIGCGNGQLVEELREKGINAFGVDIILSGARGNKPYLFEADASRIPMDSNSVDIAVSAFSIYSNLYGSQFSERRFMGFLDETNRVLKPGGRLYVAYPDPRLERLALGSEKFRLHVGPTRRYRDKDFGVLVTETDPPADGDVFQGLILEKVR